MDFHLPFPTLIHLTMVCIGKVTLDKEIRPLKKLYEVDDDNNFIYTFEVEKIVTPLEIPATLKHDLSDVITGMFCQVERSLLLYNCEEYECHERLEQRELLYDVHGKLDLATIWGRFFNSEVSEIDSLDPLLGLLNFSIAEELWYGLDAIVSKILSVACRDTDASFKKRQLVLTMHAPGANVSFVYSGISSSCLNQIQNIFHRHEYVGVIEEALFVYPPHDSENRLKSQLYYDRFQRLSDVKAGWEMFITELMLLQNSDGTIDMLKGLPQEKQLKCFALLSERYQSESLKARKNVFYTLLSTFLQWPLTHFFLPFLKFALPNLTTHHVLMLFSAIQWRIPERQRFGVLYGDLLAKYWQAVPPKVKEEFRAHGCICCNMAGRDHMAVLIEDMGELAKKNRYWSERILTEMGLMDKPKCK